PEAFRHQRQRELRLRRGMKIGRATQMVATGSRCHRTDAVVFEAADHAIVVLEMIEDAQVLAAKAGDMARTGGKHADNVHLLGNGVIDRAAGRELVELRIATKTGHLEPDICKDAVMRVLGVVDRVVDQIAADRRLDPGAGVNAIQYGLRNVTTRVRVAIAIGITFIAKGVFFLRQIIGELRADIVGDRQAEADRSAGRLRLVGVVLARGPIDVEARGDAPAQARGLGEGEAVVARILAATGRQADELAAAEEVALGDGAGNRGPGRVAAGRIAGADG